MANLTIRVWFLVAALVNYALPAASASPPGYDIIIVAGQSNAWGAGSEPTFKDSWGSMATDLRIKQIGKVADGLGVVPVGRWHNGALWDGLQHLDNRGNKDYMGFSLPFARGYAKVELDPGRTVLIVPVALGSTTIEQWLNKPKVLYGTSIFLFDNMRLHVQAALNQPGSNRIVAFLWHQGEADTRLVALNRETSAAYQEKLDRFFRLVLKGFPSSSPYPILLGKLSPEWKNIGKRSVERAMLNVASHLPCATVVSSTGLTIRHDASQIEPIHFDAQGQVDFGHRYFKAWRQLPCSLPPLQKEKKGAFH